ncbi:diguanylate cyclase (GGDEF) domain-containing protein [Poseidonocella pacifica]|uniref:Diguanylate cyclase (GGDEF) domain-containing protein n=1 Tax=Poseidonocella pacifica TaxID=871651 RepID=A0A1I0VN61_9RHOB|nr:sensor domain-containing phosphodiesterase [Poseidonocella pacifica]SFA77855.1 diguanylate cyclase (GGDEF) domain-containing protein [Poseidonocella pacifica]
MGYPVPLSEYARLKVVERLRVEEAEVDQDIERLVALAAQVAGLPIGLLSIMHADEQQFIVNHGLPELSGTPREHAFCSYPIGEGRTLHVPDAHDDARFAQNPLVVGAPHLRSYVGVPLEVEEGIHAGTLCLLGHEAHDVDTVTLDRIITIGTAITRLLCSQRDRRELDEAHAKLDFERRVVERASRTCGLTGLLNMTAFREEGTNIIDDRQESMQLALVDIDEFRTINERFGAFIGDEFLAALSESIHSLGARNCTAGRVGDDKFALLLRTVDSTAEEIIERLRAKFYESTRPLGLIEMGRLSVGLAGSENGAPSWRTLLSNAEVALHAAKSLGRDRTVRHDEAIDRVYNIKAFQSAFTEAILKGEIVPYFQPIIGLETRRIEGLEVLVRWHQDDGQVRPPAQFYKAFSDRLLAPLLTRRIADAVCDILPEWRRLGLNPGKICLNATAEDVAHPDQLMDIMHELAAAGLSPSDLTIEVTETIVMDDPEGGMRRTLQSLRDKGVRVALDDFGTGFGSLTHLSSWPVDILKIDRQFVRRLPRSEKDRHIVRSLVDLAGRLGLETVAEGIETDWQRDFVTETGCDYGQGFFYSPAVSAEEIKDLLLRERAHGRHTG